MRNYIFTFIVLGLSINNSMFSQISKGGIPKSKELNNCLPSSGLKCFVLPKLNNDSLKHVDSLQQALNDFIKRFHYGYSRSINLDYNSGTEEIVYDSLLKDSIYIWRIYLKSPSAYSNFIVLDTFHLPCGSKFFAYNPTNSHILGAFTCNNNKPYQRFSIGPLLGDEIILEYNASLSLSVKPRIHLDYLVHNFKNILNKDHVLDFGDAGICNINVLCEHPDWCDQRRSVVNIATLTGAGHFDAFCTGSLLNSERRDFRPYFLTAMHCLDDDDNNSLSDEEKNQVQDWIFLFNYQSDVCDDPTLNPEVTAAISGAEFVSSRFNSDFALLELSARPTGDFNTFYPGWDNSNNNPQSGGTIHHPGGDIKKISLYDKEAKKRKFFDVIPLTKTWKVKWSDGVTEGGSSGAPLFNENGLVVGQLWGGKSSCDKPNKADYFGRFDKSWDAGNSAAERLRDWLSPNSTSNLFIQSIFGEDPCKPNYFFENTNDLHTSANINFFTNPASAGTRTYNGVYTAIGTIETGANVTIQSGTSVEFQAETIILGLGFHAQAGSNFIATPQPCLEGCNTGVGKKADDIVNDEPFIVLNTDNPKHEEESEEEENELQAVIVSENIQIYPNPNAGKFEVVFSSENTECSKIIICDIAGKQIFEQNNITQSKIIIDISTYQKGIYIVKLILSKDVYTKKIILQ